MINQKRNSVVFPNINKVDYLSSHITLEDFQSMLESRKVPQDLYTHPVVASFLGKTLEHFSHLTPKQMNRFLDKVMTVSPTNHSFSIVLNDTENDGNGKIFTYTIKSSLLIYTKQIFINHSCSILIKHFDQKGNRLYSEKEFHSLSSIQSTIIGDIKEEKDDLSL